MEVRCVTAGMANQWERMDQTINVSEAWGNKCYLKKRKRKLLGET